MYLAAVEVEAIRDPRVSKLMHICENHDYIYCRDTSRCICHHRAHFWTQVHRLQGFLQELDTNDFVIKRSEVYEE